jgi:hypothetical protein
LARPIGILESDKQIIQYKRKMIEDAQNQRWYYREDGVIYPQTNPNLVLDIRVSAHLYAYCVIFSSSKPFYDPKGNWTKPGTVVLLYERKYEDNLNQLWDLIPCETANASSLQNASRSSLNTSNDDSEDEYAFSSATYAL